MGGAEWPCIYIGEYRSFQSGVWRYTLLFMGQVTSEQVTEERTSEQVTEERTSEQVTEERTSEQMTEERKSKQVMEERKSEQVTEEKKSKQVMEERMSGQVMDVCTVNIMHLSKSCPTPFLGVYRGLTFLDVNGPRI